MTPRNEKRTKGARRLRQALASGAALSAIGWDAAGAAPPTVIEIRPPATATAAKRASSPSRGLGFLVTDEGFALTTYRNLLIEGTSRLHPAVDVVVRGLGDETPVRAVLVGVEPTLDLAILKLETDGLPAGSPFELEIGYGVGDEIYAPSQLDGDAVALGRLTGLNSKECYQETLTAAMYRAEIELPDVVAGTPVYIGDGEVVAIHTAYVPEATADHADDPDEMHLLPLVLVRNIFNSLVEKGSFRSPWTGFSVRALAAEEASRVPTDRGFRGGVALEAIWPGSPAEKMGLREGDVLLQLGHNRTESVADFQKWLYLYGVGENVKLVVLRGEELLTTDYEIEERPDWAKPR
jgi:serine protease Do